ncbi:MAG TPA: transporter substrate-binding domain-containing protein [Actinomycetota bacterium]|nr:transporter substrate-binding domain-containing protein [Actinomycetota bacterium]
MPLKKASVVALGIVVAALLSSCVPAEPELLVYRRYDPALTVMGVIQEEGVLRVGVPDDQPALAREVDGEYEGLTVDLGRAVADALRVELEVVPAPSEDLLDMVRVERTSPTEILRGELDIAFPLVPITEKSARNNSFTDPYLLAHQRLLLPSETADLELDPDGPVCSLIDPDTGVDLTTLDPDVEVYEASGIDDCVERLRSSRRPMATGPDVVLRGIQLRLEEVCSRGRCAADEVPVITGDALNTEGYGAAVQSGASGWKSFIETAFRVFELDGKWHDPTDLGDDVPPVLRVEDAAALYPAE